MTVNEEKTILKLELHDEGYDEFTICGNLGNDECMIMLVLPKGMEEEARAFVDEVNKLIQPKTTSTDIEKLRKEFIERFGVEIANGEDRGKRTIGSSWSRTNGSPKDIWNFFLPHLSNKSELKKEAVREFVKFVDERLTFVGYMDTDIKGATMPMVRRWAEQYLSSNEKEGK